MKNFKKQQASGTPPSFSFNLENLALVFVSFLTLTATFFISNSAFSFQSRTFIFVIVIGFYLLSCGGFYFLQNRRKMILDKENEGSKIFSPEIEEKLFCLEETNTYFVNSLKFADTFRLVSNRINEIVPFADCVLILVDENTKRLKIVQASGENAEYFLTVDLSRKAGLDEKVFQDGQAQFDEKLLLETNVFSPEILKNLKAAAAFPLRGDDKNVFGVFELFCAEQIAERNVPGLLDEISRRVSPLFLKSLTFERNLENSLTDSLTKLPNERAFYLILENQIAESQRFRNERPLTVLNMDIQSFDEINRNYGYATGDRVLVLAAKIIKSQLRQMDFLARSKGDEFLAVLPTASEEITKVIIGRIEKAFLENPFEIAEDREINIKLNFGVATFIKDGETAPELLKRAVLKKQNVKSPVKSGVLLFPSEVIN